MKLLLGVTGSVAAILVPRMSRALFAEGHEVQIVSTQRGLYFFESKKLPVKVWTDKDEWPEGGWHKEDPVPHIDLGQWADLILLAPLTADTLSDMANGKCDKFLTSIVRAWPREKPMVIAPAMNTRMWEHPITQEHIEKLKTFYQLTVIEPITKRLACGDIGKGAMAEIQTIIETVQLLSKSHP